MSMQGDDRVLIVGAGPVGLTAAANLVRQNIPVTVFEASDDLSRQSRASTFHPPTLDMLDELGFAKALVTQGLVAPTVQYRTKADGILGAFDFGAIGDLTRHPYRLQAEQFKLTRIIYDGLKDNPLFSVEFGKPVAALTQDADGVSVVIGRESPETRRGRWLIGADGARSVVRRALDIDFEGFTWPERFLVVTTAFDVDALIPDLASVTYVADPERWHFLLRIPGAWRVMVPVEAEVADDVASGEAYARVAMTSVFPADAVYDIQHITLYRVHQRVAKSFRQGRAFLVGDAAHVNNPLGGMGMNGGIHDAINLTGRLGEVTNNGAPESELNRYDLQRRLVTLEYVQTATIKNKRDLEARDEQDRQRFRDELRATAADPEKTRQFLTRISMIASLRRAEELG
ncbi:FAD-dependent monooxygenase [Hyphomicrobiales bacterium]|nr:FAD-dependent monooxygenase [Hyphomicrobiales bacterium]CAH1689927.1 FAD-dependent monooxygenase [Hyphomicrobiales bacterium]